MSHKDSYGICSKHCYNVRSFLKLIELKHTLETDSPFSEAQNNLVINLRIRISLSEALTGYFFRVKTKLLPIYFLKSILLLFKQNNVCAWFKKLVNKSLLSPKTVRLSEQPTFIFLIYLGLVIIFISLNIFMISFFINFRNYQLIPILRDKFSLLDPNLFLLNSQLANLYTS